MSTPIEVIPFTMTVETVSQLERLREIGVLQRDLMVSLDEAAGKTVAGLETNCLDVPEIRRYQRQVLEGVIVITYEQRRPGERDWQPVRIIKLV